jgi:hypothetical protein
MLALKRSHLKRADYNNCSVGHSFSHFYVQSPCILVEDSTEIYMIDEGHIPSIKCEKGPKSLRKVDVRSLMVTNFYFPALTP